ncbi:MAG: MBOAT family protein [Kiritimatiellia bacterium]
MLFNSLEFLVFFPLVTALYFLLPHRFRWALLLAASYYFYMCWKAEYIILIVVSTLIDYIAGRRMGALPLGHGRRRLWLSFSLISNLGLLFSFKYFNFFNDSVRAVFQHYNLMYDIPAFKLLLPVGISFYTFQTLSYSIDVYRGRQQAERHLGIFALYVTFFPQLVAGPIERCSRLLPQFYERHHFDYVRVTDGLKLMLWGFFKKLVIADRLAIFVSTVYQRPCDYDGVSFIVATVFFAFQIYCDFSGYSDIAIGSAQVMGFSLMDNFNRPYFSKSISEFWGRWHISLSTWFRDYLYIPLGGNRVSKPRWYFNLFLVFLLSGLWHGANWTFLVWGALHGFYLIFAIWTAGLRARLCALTRLDRLPHLHKLVNVAVTFALVCFAWIFFRAGSLYDALYMVRHLFSGIPNWLQNLFALDTDAVLRPLLVGQTLEDFLLAVGAIAFMELIHLFQRHGHMRQMLGTWPLPLRWAACYLMIAAIIVLGRFNITEFIYFQF